MAIYAFHYRVSANMHYNPNMVYNRPTDPSLARFSELLWHGCDNEGNCVYRKDPINGEVLRIDFF